MKLRTTYSGFTSAVNSYFDKLIPRITPLQVPFSLTWWFYQFFFILFMVFTFSPLTTLQYKQGGPIIAVQVENEYGSYAKDEQYLSFIKEVWKNIKSLLQSLSVLFLKYILLCLHRLLSKLLGIIVPGSLRASHDIRQPGRVKMWRCGWR